MSFPRSSFPDRGILSGSRGSPRPLRSEPFFYDIRVLLPGFSRDYSRSFSRASLARPYQTEGFSRARGFTGGLPTYFRADRLLLLPNERLGKQASSSTKPRSFSVRLLLPTLLARSTWNMPRQRFLLVTCWTKATANDFCPKSTVSTIDRTIDRPRVLRRSNRRLNATALLGLDFTVPRGTFELADSVCQTSSSP